MQDKDKNLNQTPENNDAAEAESAAVHNTGAEVPAEDAVNVPAAEMPEDNGSSSAENEAVENPENTAEGSEENKESGEEDGKKNKKNKKEKKKKKKSDEPGQPDKIKNANALKRGSFSLIIIAIFCACLVLVNILATVIASNFPTTLDVTTDRSSKLTAENIDYIRQLSEQTDIEKIEIIVCATRASYTGTDMINYVYNYYGVSENNTPYNYFNQTVRLIEEYPKYNNKIAVSYMDPQEPGFNLLESESDISITYGDILVRCTKRDNSAEEGVSVKSDVLTFTDIYETQSSTDAYGNISGYTIVVSNIENALSSSLNKVAMGVTKKAAILQTNCDPSSLTYLQSSLESYDYTFTTIDGRVSDDALKDVDLLIISKLQNDFDSETLKVFDRFLENDGKLGKSIAYFADQSSPATPNFNQFLEEWGINQLDGVVYETNSSYHNYQSHTTIMQQRADNDITKSLQSSVKYYWSDGNTPFETAYTERDTRTVNVLLASSDSTIIAPKGTAGGYTAPSTTTRKSYPTIILTMDERTTDDGETISSGVIAFASTDFLSYDWSQYSDVGNMDFATLSINAAAGRDNSLYFTPKITGVTGIAMPASAAVKGAVIIIFNIALPVLCILGGIVVWTIRRRR